MPDGHTAPGVFLARIADIRVSDRQRTTIESTADLEESIKRIGQINPIILRRREDSYEGWDLVAGERRLRAMTALHHQFILARDFASLDPFTRILIELDENIRRVDLPWLDMIKAIDKYHQLRVENESDWSVEKTAEALGFSSPHMYRYIRVAKEVAAGNERVLACDSLKSAINTMERETERKVHNELSQLDLVDEPESRGTPEVHSRADDKPAPAPRTLIRAASDDILNTSFLEWAPTYAGRKFNLLHCDFPYGINHQRSAQGGSDRLGSYDDSPDTYWQLVRCLLTNQDRILYPSAHCIFWFSMNYYQGTIDAFEDAGWFVVPHPLIWMKSDGKGIASDVERRPKHTYETALFMSRGDRKIISPIADCYAAPTSKSIHQSEKPEPVLKHFLRLCCDGLAELLDPTAGSGSALRAAEALGCRRVLGLEINPEYCESARAALQRARNLASLSEKL